jgi:hypothetical protein
VPVKNNDHAVGGDCACLGDFGQLRHFCLFSCLSALTTVWQAYKELVVECVRLEPPLCRVLSVPVMSDVCPNLDPFPGAPNCPYDQPYIERVTCDFPRILLHFPFFGLLENTVTMCHCTSSGVATLRRCDLAQPYHW